jgi:hypothetical protein
MNKFILLMYAVALAGSDVNGTQARDSARYANDRPESAFDGRSASYGQPSLTVAPSQAPDAKPEPAARPEKRRSSRASDGPRKVHPGFFFCAAAIMMIAACLVSPVAGMIVAGTALGAYAGYYLG